MFCHPNDVCGAVESATLRPQYTLQTYSVPANLTSCQKIVSLRFCMEMLPYSGFAA